ncbi:MAG: hypothetical protein Q4E70_00325 [Candidatus Saccharibacteria bacterium]|nr:hypothetical protein [Candidatus Saccharibacteria bacterium]
MKNENKQILNIKFEKDSHSINAETYAKSLTALNTLIKEVNYQTNKINGDINVKVVSEKAGSFDVFLELAEAIDGEKIGLILSGIEAISSVVMAVVAVIELKRLLANPENTVKINNNSVDIVGSNNNVIYNTNITNYNLYANNQTINDAVSAQFQAVKNDAEIEAVDINCGDNISTRIEKDHFDSLSQKRTIEVRDEKVSVVSATLVVSKLVLDNKDRKWQFVYQGNKINATIVDGTFWDRVLNGEESFSNGDRLICDLEIIRDYNESLGVFIDSDYIVRNIRDHKNRESYKQLEL